MGGTFCDIADTDIVFQCKNVDCISFCEGEAIWLDLAKSFESGGGFENVKGIAYRNKEGAVIVNPEREYVDLTTLPILDYSLVDVKAYRQYLYGCKNLMYVYLSKGCPSKCTFCANQITHRCTYRRRSFEHFDYKKIDFFLSKTDNFSNVKRKELEVVQSYYLWKAIFKKDYSEETLSYDLFIKHIITLFRRLSFCLLKQQFIAYLNSVFFVSDSSVIHIFTPVYSENTG